MNSSRIHILSVREIKNGRGRKNTSRVLYRVNVNPLVQLEFQPIFTTNCDTRASNVDARAVFRAAEVKQQNIDLGAHTTRFHPRMKVVHAGPSGAYIPLTYVDRFDEVDDEDPLFWPSCKSALRYEVMAYEKLKPYNHPAFLEYHGVCLLLTSSPRHLSDIYERKHGVRLMHRLGMVFNEISPEIIAFPPEGGAVFRTLSLCLPVGADNTYVMDECKVMNKAKDREFPDVASYESDYYCMQRMWNTLAQKSPGFRVEWNRTHGGPPFPGY
ncbi:hypothetical protein PLICRDRAFT_30860 [Plicaturopsis crispa FD-325 SS-3]|nr:hypothetical protein PLICRDRAFT_30860 [Plicaturopsis crispa FD-325 SS-3]